MRTVLIIGGSYFIGPSVVDALRHEGHEVAVLNRGTRGVPGTRQIIADRNSSSQMHAAAAEVGDVDAIVDLSCYNATQAAIAHSAFRTRTPHWIHLSTAAVYSGETSQPFAEGDATGGGRAWGQYGSDKSAAEEWLRARPSPGSTTILRAAYALGPRNYLDRETFVWARLLRQRPIIIPGDGRTMIQHVHVDDLAQAVTTAMRTVRSGVSIYNVGYHAPFSFRDFAEQCAAVAEVQARIVYLHGEREAVHSPNEGRPHAQPHLKCFAFYDTAMTIRVDSIHRELGWSARISLLDGLRQTFGRYSVQRLRECAINTRYEDGLLSSM